MLEAKKHLVMALMTAMVVLNVSAQMNTLDNIDEWVVDTIERDSNG